MTPAPPPQAATSAERVRFEHFRIAWVNKHGAGAAKEAKLDRARKPPGATWSSAAPSPFKVLHLASPPPLAEE